MKTRTPLMDTASAAGFFVFRLAASAALAAALLPLGARAETATNVYNLGAQDAGTTIGSDSFLATPWIAKGALPPGSILRSVSINGRLDTFGGGDTYAYDFFLYVDPSPTPPSDDAILQIGGYDPLGDPATKLDWTNVDWGSDANGDIGTRVAGARTAGCDFPAGIDLSRANVFLGSRGWAEASWSGTVTVVYDAPPPAAILTFGVSDTPALIDGASIVLNLPPGACVTNLAPTFTLSPGASASPASGTALDFTLPQTYRVVSADGSHTNEYKVWAVGGEISYLPESRVLQTWSFTNANDPGWAYAGPYELTAEGIRLGAVAPEGAYTGYYVGTMQTPAPLGLRYTNCGVEMTFTGTSLEYASAASLLSMFTPAGARGTNPIEGFTAAIANRGIGQTLQLADGTDTLWDTPRGSVVGSHTVALARLADGTVKFYLDGVLKNAAPSAATTGYPSLIGVGPLPVGTVVSQVRAFVLGSSTNSVGGSTLPEPWRQADIGVTTRPGGAFYSEGVFRVGSGGYDTQDWEDACGFVYQPLRGNWRIVARVAEQANTDAWAKAGVMIREDLTPGARSAFVGLTPVNGSVFEGRGSPGGYPEPLSLADGLRAPAWVALSRTGNVFCAYVSTNGVDWVWRGWTEIQMPDEVFFGLAVSPHSYWGVFGDASFDGVGLGAAAPPPLLFGQGDGLAGSYFANPFLHGAAVRQVDPQIDFDWNYGAPPIGGPFSEGFSMAWVGEVQAQVSEPYAFRLTANDGVRLWLNEQLLINNWHFGSTRETDSAPVNLVAGQRYLLRLEYYRRQGPAQLKLQWSSPTTSPRCIPASQLYSQFTDSDHDGMPDLWELAYGLNPNDPTDANLDPDGDGLTNLQEFLARSNPRVADTDGDGMPDGWEVAHGLNPNDARDAAQDPDGDGLTNLEEMRAGTDMNNPDTDGDGFSDGEEVNDGMGAIQGGGSGAPSEISSIETVATVLGASALTNAGQWSVQGTSLVCSSLRGSVAYAVAAPTAGVFRVELQVRDLGALETRPGWLDVSIDGESVGRVCLPNNLALNKTAAASSIYGTGYEVANAFDGNSSTRWSSEFSDPQWIYVDLGATYAITQVKLNWETACGRDYTLSVASEGAGGLDTDTPWTTIKSVTGNTTAGVLDYAGLSGTGRYVRLKGTARATGWGYSLWGMEVHGPLHVFTPWLKAGIHTVGLYWDNSVNGASLGVEALRLQVLQGADSDHNGISDWMERRVRRLSSLEVPSLGAFSDLEPATTPAAPMAVVSCVSPICVEGRGLGLDMMGFAQGAAPLRGQNNHWFDNLPQAWWTNAVAYAPSALAAQAGVNRRWFLNLPLDATQATALQVSHQNGALTQYLRAAWVPLNLLNATDLSLRAGDTLLMGVAPKDHPGVGQAAQIAIAGVTNYNLQVKDTVAHCFAAPGTYAVTGTWHAPGHGTSQSRTINVKVVAAEFNGEPACPVGQTVAWDCPGLPAEAVVESDARLSVSELAPPAGGGRSLGLYTEEAVQLGLLARLGTNGPVLATTRAYGVELFSSGNVLLKQIEVLPDGSQLVEMTTLLNYLPPGVTVQIHIFVGGVMFEDGSVDKWLTAADFNAFGVNKVRFIRPASAQTGVCHTIYLYQNGRLLGEY